MKITTKILSKNKPKKHCKKISPGVPLWPPPVAVPEAARAHGGLGHDHELDGRVGGRGGVGVGQVEHHGDAPAAAAQGLVLPRVGLFVD